MLSTAIDVPLRDAKVDQIELVHCLWVLNIVAYHNVFRLKVAMNETLAMKLLQEVEQLNSHCHHTLDREVSPILLENVFNTEA